MLIRNREHAVTRRTLLQAAHTCSLWSSNSPLLTCRQIFATDNFLGTEINLHGGHHLRRSAYHRNCATCNKSRTVAAGAVAEVIVMGSQYVRKYGSRIIRNRRKEKKGLEKGFPTKGFIAHALSQREPNPRTSPTKKRKKKNRHLCFCPRVSGSNKPLPMHSLNFCQTPRQQSKGRRVRRGNKEKL